VIKSPLARIIRANKHYFRFRITDIMFEGTAEELKETKVTQLAVFFPSLY
jgi:[acyl-carrier-protein] S-malonyltransferase